jgi:UDP-glucose 4-epimerase
VEAALAGQDLKVTGDGTQTRCFTHVADVVAAMAKLMDTPASVGQVFNLGSDREVSMNELAARVISAVGAKSKVQHVSYEAFYGRAFDDMMRRVPDLIASVIRDRRDSL